MKRVLLTVVLLAPAAGAQTVIGATARGVLVAQRGTVQMWDRAARSAQWSLASVQTPTAIVASADRAAVLDAVANTATIIELNQAKATTVATGETPIDGVFVAGALYVLDRDARILERIRADGTKASVALAADPAFVRQSNGKLYVYSRLDGVLQEITVAPFAVQRSVRVMPSASDFEVDAKNAYLVYPRGANIGVVTLATMKTAGKIAVGAVPVDLSFTSAGTALTARTLAIADPSGKRVWLIEGAQSVSQAIARGFLRGLLGLGLLGKGGSEFPTGVDRVAVRGSRWYAYDSSSRTLYRFTKKKSTAIAKNVAATAFSVAPDAIYTWDDTVRRLQRLDAE